MEIQNGEFRLDGNTSGVAHPTPLLLDPDSIVPQEERTRHRFLQFISDQWTTTAPFQVIYRSTAGGSSFLASVGKYIGSVIAVFAGGVETYCCVLHSSTPTRVTDTDEAPSVLSLIQGPQQQAWVGADCDLITDRPQVDLQKPLGELASLIDDISALRPLSVSDEVRSLAQRVVVGRSQSPSDEESIKEWARKLAESVSDADD